MLVHIENLVKRYGDLLALDHLSLDIEEGEIFGLLGPNGSGKTTAINCLLALLKYDKGTITIFGKDMKPDSYDIKQDIGVVMQNVAVFEQMSVYENIDYFCEISDNGCGIAPEDQEHIFEPFITHKVDGTGLGLAITRRIIQAHHGTITLRSARYAGTVFILTLPIEKNS